jgi:rhamnosyltransferase
MKRYFDMGVFHARASWIRAEFGGAEKEGIKFIRSEFCYLLRHAFWRIPEAMLRLLPRYIGFRLGLLENRIPLKIKKKISMNSGYFNTA